MVIFILAVSALFFTNPRFFKGSLDDIPEGERAVAEQAIDELTEKLLQRELTLRPEALWEFGENYADGEFGRIASALQNVTNQITARRADLAEEQHRLEEFERVELPTAQAQIDRLAAAEAEINLATAAATAAWAAVLPVQNELFVARDRLARAERNLDQILNSIQFQEEVDAAREALAEVETRYNALSAEYEAVEARARAARDEKTAARQAVNAIGGDPRDRHEALREIVDDIVATVTALEQEQVQKREALTDLENRRDELVGQGRQIYIARLRASQREQAERMIEDSIVIEGRSAEVVLESVRGESDSLEAVERAIAELERRRTEENRAAAELALPPPEPGPAEEPVEGLAAEPAGEPVVADEFLPEPEAEPFLAPEPEEFFDAESADAPASVPEVAPPLSGGGGGGGGGAGGGSGGAVGFVAPPSQTTQVIIKKAATNIQTDIKGIESKIKEVKKKIAKTKLKKAKKALQKELSGLEKQLKDAKKKLAQAEKQKTKKVAKKKFKKTQKVAAKKSKKKVLRGALDSDEEFTAGIGIRPSPLYLNPYQASVIALSFLIVFLFAIFIQWRDKRSEVSKKHVESFSVLMSVFFWGVAMTFLLKMSFDLIDFYYPAIGQSQWFFIIGLFLEELVKIAALIIGLNVAGKLFNELSDGVIYTAFAALGFLFLENIIYVLRDAVDARSFAEIFIGRNIFTLGVHFFTMIFGVHYAFAYLYGAGKTQIQPWQIFKHIKILWKQYGALFFLWLPVSPFITLWKFFSKGLKLLTIPEMLWSGFLLSSYLHIGYDLVLMYEFGNPLVGKIVQGITFLFVLVFLWVIFQYFPKLDVAVKDIEEIKKK